MVIAAPISLASVLFIVKSAARVAVKRMFNRVGLDVVARATVPDLIASQHRLISEMTQSMAQQSAAHPYIQPSSGQGSGDKRLNYEHLNQELKWRDQIIAELQFKLERSYKYQSIMADDQIRAGMKNLEPEFLALFENCKGYTMTSWERQYALYKVVHHVVENRIPGDIVECGVWRGGSMRLAALTLLALKSTDRKLFLYDTYEGMTEPQPEIDVDFAGNKAINDWEQFTKKGLKWAYAPVEEVRQTMIETGYPMENIRFVKGPVEQTIPGTIPEQIALLRLDTDWYSSTKHEMEHLYPRLSSRGILLLDDYGHYRGAQRGVDEYIAMLESKPLLHRVDYAARIAIKA